MSYRIEAASKEEWAERAINAEKKLAVLEDSIKELFSLLDATEETDEVSGFLDQIVERKWATTEIAQWKRI